MTGAGCFSYRRCLCTSAPGNDRCTAQTQGRAQPVAGFGQHAVCNAQPEQGGGDVHAAVCRINPPAGGRMQGKQIGKQRKAGSSNHALLPCRSHKYVSQQPMISASAVKRKSSRVLRMEAFMGGWSGAGCFLGLKSSLHFLGGYSTIG